MEGILGGLFLLGLVFAIGRLLDEVKWRKEDSISKEYAIPVALERHPTLIVSIFYSAGLQDSSIKFVRLANSENDIRHDLSDSEWKIVQAEVVRFTREKRKSMGLTP